MVIVAFATVYIVWGSTYFFIQLAIQGIPAMLMGAMRYIAAGLIVLAWCALKGDKIWVKRDVINAAIVGLILLAVGNGVVIWVEQVLPSAMVAIMVSANPIWFVVLDKRNRKANLASTATIAGLIIGFAGVILLFGEQVVIALGNTVDEAKIWGVGLLVLGPIAWSAGSLYAKYKGSSSPAGVTTGWQMLIAGIAFLPAAALHHEFKGFDITRVPTQSWLAVLYLIFFGSIAAFTAYVWLLQIRPATQVSTHSYINPVIAVLLGVVFAHEHISWLQIAGLVIILLSVLLINMAKYRQDAHNKKLAAANSASASEAV
ncbi:EamA family transporter [Mucilaginibacter phyllosphaerae]|nr:EamA family transporter [Mucilaginibacter phyllosphaerae]